MLLQKLGGETNIIFVNLIFVIFFWFDYSVLHKLVLDIFANELKVFDIDRLCLIIRLCDKTWL